jgi:hypothetical protein
MEGTGTGRSISSGTGAQSNQGMPDAIDFLAGAGANGRIFWLLAGRPGQREKAGAGEPMVRKESPGFFLIR